MRAVVDPNVIISALLSPGGTTARVLRHWIDGSYELVVSPLLLAELERALAYPKLRARVTEAESNELIEVLRRHAELVDDPNGPPTIRSSDPGDDYLITLAAGTRSIIVSGDHDLRNLKQDLPVFSPTDFLSLLDNDS